MDRRIRKLSRGRILVAAEQIVRLDRVNDL